MDIGYYSLWNYSGSYIGFSCLCANHGFTLQVTLVVLGLAHITILCNIVDFTYQ